MTDAPPMYRLSRTPAPSAGAGNQLQRWVTTHKAAAGAAAAGLVAGLALLRKHMASSSSTTTSTGNTTGSGSLGTAADGSTIAGLTASPDTSTTDIENWVQDQLNAMQQQINSATQAPPAPPPPAPKPTPKPTPTKPKPKPPAPTKPAPKPKRKPAAPRYYTVAHGDTLSGIASRNHIAGGWQTLWKLNKSTIKNPDLIYPGQRIVL